MLVASLHQGISDLMPTRLEFYENWLNPTGMRDGKIGLAPLAAVLSFLRQEGEPYTLVTQRAGEYAAQWTFDSLLPMQRSLIRALPVMMRARVAMHLAKKVVHRTYHGSRGRCQDCGAGRERFRCETQSFAPCASRSTGRCACSIRRRSRICSRSSTSAAKCGSTRAWASATPAASSRSTFLPIRNDDHHAGSRFRPSVRLLICRHSPQLPRVRERISSFHSRTRPENRESTGSAKPPPCSLPTICNALGRRAYTREERLEAFEQLQVPAGREPEPRHGHSAGPARRRHARRDRIVGC